MAIHAVVKREMRSETRPFKWWWTSVFNGSSKSTDTGDAGIGIRTLHPFTESAEKAAWLFIDGGIRNIRTTTGFSSRVSMHLQGTGRRTSRRVTVFCGRKSRVRYSPSFNTLKFPGIPTLPRPTFKGSTETCALCGPL